MTWKRGSKKLVATQILKCFDLKSNNRILSGTKAETPTTNQNSARIIITHLSSIQFNIYYRKF